MEELKLNTQTYFSRSKFDATDSGTEEEENYDEEEEEPTKANLIFNLKNDHKTLKQWFSTLGSLRSTKPL